VIVSPGLSILDLNEEVAGEGDSGHEPTPPAPYPALVSDATVDSATRRIQLPILTSPPLSACLGYDRSVELTNIVDDVLSSVGDDNDGSEYSTSSGNHPVFLTSMRIGPTNHSISVITRSNSSRGLEISCEKRMDMIPKSGPCRLVLSIASLIIKSNAPRVHAKKASTAWILSWMICFFLRLGRLKKCF